MSGTRKMKDSDDKSESCSSLRSSTMPPLRPYPPPVFDIPTGKPIHGKAKSNGCLTMFGHSQYTEQTPRQESDPAPAPKKQGCQIV